MSIVEQAPKMAHLTNIKVFIVSHATFDKFATSVGFTFGLFIANKTRKYIKKTVNHHNYIGDICILGSGILSAFAIQSLMHVKGFPTIATTALVVHCLNKLM